MYYKTLIAMLEGSQREEQKEKVENAFKNVFKYYKSKKPPPCLNDVLNPHNADHNEHFTCVTSLLLELLIAAKLN